MKYFYIFLCSGFMLTCTSFNPTYEVPDEFQPFVEQFVAEAKARGHNIDIDNLIIRYDESIPSSHCGQCNSNELNTDIQKVITINPNLNCWLSDEEKEAFLFHELGHCILGRLHDYSLLPNSDPKSIMIENNLGLYSPCAYPIDNLPCNNIHKRPYYIDELFDETTEVPEWGK